MHVEKKDLIAVAEDVIRLARMAEALRPADVCIIGFTASDATGRGSRRAVTFEFGSEDKALAFLEAVKAASGKN
jgi:hypothetical protein